MFLDFEIQNILNDIPVSFGVAIKNLRSGEKVLLNADCPFQLDNVFKIPILVAAMQQIDEGRFRLHDRIMLHDFQKVYPNDILSSMEDGMRLPIKNLLTLMITVSDNTAIDMALDLLGGTQTVNSAMRRLGFTSSEINITKSMHETIGEALGISPTCSNTLELVKSVISEGNHFNGHTNHNNTNENIATPRAINRLNEMIFRGKVASHRVCEDAIAILLQQTLNTRLQSRFPLDDPNIDAIYNLGTLFGIQNDSGIIYIKDKVYVVITILTRKEGHLIYNKVMSSDFKKIEWQVNLAIRRIARLAYDYWRES